MSEYNSLLMFYNNIIVRTRRNELVPVKNVTMKETIEDVLWQPFLRIASPLSPLLVLCPLDFGYRERNLDRI